MTREQAKALLPIIQAYAEGKEVELKAITNDGWIPMQDPEFYPQSEYRIKPEPREFWLVQIGNDTLFAYSSHTTAQKRVDLYGSEVIHVREVLP